MRTSPVKNSVERALVEAEGLVRDFSEDNPATKVTVLRFANVLGTPPDDADQPQPRATGLPVHVRLRPAPAVPRGGRRRPGAAARDAGRHPGPVQRRRRRAAPLERGGQHLRHAAGAAVARAAPSRSVPLPASSTSRPNSRISCVTDAASTRAASHRPASPTPRRARAPYGSSSGPCACAASPDARRARTPTNTMSSSSSAIRRRSSARARSDSVGQPLGDEVGLRSRPLLGRDRRSARGPPRRRRSRGTAARRPPRGSRASRPRAGWRGSAG